MTDELEKPFSKQQTITNHNQAVLDGIHSDQTTKPQGLESEYVPNPFETKEANEAIRNGTLQDGEFD